MREIKFRAWEIEDKKYYPVIKLWFDSQVGKPDSAELWLSRYANEIADIPEQIELEQYTGLKDKNGKEIYEGDIIREKWHDSETHMGRDRIAKVEFFCDSYICCFRGGVVTLGLLAAGNIEVIGNIHENPELIGDANVTNKEEE